jgi:hypothetical protein
MALNVVGGLCGLLILCDLGLGLANGRLNQSVATTQAQLGQAQQIESTLQKLVLRVGRAAQTDPALRALLARHDFRVDLNTNRQTQPAP